VKLSNRLVSRAIVPLAIAALPLVLLFSSLRTLREIDEQRSVYLRHRVAMLAARLENLPAEASTSDQILADLGQNEPDLVSVQVIQKGAAGDDPALTPIWEGRELFRTGLVTSGEHQLFQAYVPFHSGGALRIARIELAGSAADFLVVHARHNVIVSSVAGVVLAVLSIVALWAVRRAERMRVHELEMEHLAHIGKMAAVLAHEIRNPLGTIKGFVQLAGESASERTRDLLSPALSEVRRLESLVNDLLAYGRPPAPHSGPVRWRDIASSLRGHAQQLPASRAVQVTVEEADVDLFTDETLLGQALLNLLRNAVEAIPPGTEGLVRVDIAAEASRVSISVTDSGPGISDEALAKLYEPFFTTKAFGTGLGLAITRRLVESLGGGLEVRRRITGGTAAIIELPGRTQQPPATAGNNHGNDSHS
jgi:signal transduction histidine kinase